MIRWLRWWWTIGSILNLRDTTQSATSRYHMVLRTLHQHGMIGSQPNIRQNWRWKIWCWSDWWFWIYLWFWWSSSNVAVIVVAAIKWSRSNMNRFASSRNRRMSKKSKWWVWYRCVDVSKWRNFNNKKGKENCINSFLIFLISQIGHNLIVFVRFRPRSSTLILELFFAMERVESSSLNVHGHPSRVFESLFQICVMNQWLNM